jgi:hypothetical protein
MKIYINSYLLGTRKNCHKNGKNPLLLQLKKKGDRMDCNNYRGISLLTASYKILWNILLSRRIPYAKEITGLLWV